MKPEQLYSYLAGFVDADGSINISHVKGGSYWNERYVLKIHVSNACKEVLDIFVRVFGGKVYIQNRNNTVETRNDQNRKNWKAGYYWSVTATLAAQSIEKLLPYLRVKFHQGRLCLRMHRLKQKYSGSLRRWHPEINDKCLRAYRDIYMHCRVCNNNGSEKKAIYRNMEPNKGCVWAYMAGFIDADGSISIRTETKDRLFVPTLSVYNTMFAPIKLFTKYGGKCRHRVPSDKISCPGWLACYHWSIVKKKASTIIEQIYPFLVVKKRQARLVLLLQRLRDKYNGGMRRQNPDISKKCNRVYSKIKERCKALNQRGLQAA